MGNKLDIQSERYGKLVALYCTEERTSNGGFLWAFKCDCGNIKICPVNSVRTGKIQSCGCLNRPHGKTGTRLFTIWVNMRQRCKHDGKPEHDNWGNRGITVCDEWNDYLTFEKWALENGYSENLTIDRIDVNGNYEPGNCRWATYTEQANNTRVTRFVTINGETHSVSEWCRLLNITHSTVYVRIRKYGWNIEKALTYPRKRGQRIGSD